MFRRDRWWVREIERLNRSHAEERALLLAALTGVKPGPTEPREEPKPRPTTPSPEQMPEEDWS